MTPPFIDLHKIDEDQRIDMIGHQAIDHGRVVGFIVELEDAKGDRYIAKLKQKFPAIKIIDRSKMTMSTELIRVGPASKGDA
jgi:hypothetical protein